METGLLVLRGIADRVGAPHGARLCVERNRRQLVMRQVARVEASQEAHGLYVQQVAMKKSFGEAEAQAAHNAGQGDGTCARGHLLLPCRPEGEADEHPQ